MTSLKVFVLRDLILSFSIIFPYILQLIFKCLIYTIFPKSPK